jgi:hypothetical protein
MQYFVMQEREKQIALKQLKMSKEKLREKYFERKVLETVAAMKAREDREAEQRHHAVIATQVRAFRCGVYHCDLALFFHSSYWSLRCVILNIQMLIHVTRIVCVFDLLRMINWSNYGSIVSGNIMKNWRVKKVKPCNDFGVVVHGAPSVVALCL